MTRLKNNINYENNQSYWDEQQFSKIDNQFNVSPIDLNSFVINNERPPKPIIWLAWAQLNARHSSLGNPNKLKASNKTQRQAVRLLLSQLLHHYKGDFLPNIRADYSGLIRLDESKYPYRLMPSGHYVSFSHSNNTVSCAISSTPIGIDIELSDVSLSVAKRFYHEDEIHWIEKLDNGYQQDAINLLWKLKEATIKRLSEQVIETNLMKGLKTNLTTPAKRLLLQRSSHSDTHIDKKIHHTKFKGTVKSANHLHSLVINYVYLKSSNIIICI